MATMEEEAHELEGDGIVDLFTIFLTALPKSRAENNMVTEWFDTHARVNFKAMDTVTWFGITFEGIPLKFEGAGQTEGDEKKRPSLTMANTNAVFSPLVRDGVLDNAPITRWRIRRQDLENNPETEDVIRQTWRISRVTSMDKHQIDVELRDQLDGPLFRIPNRMFTPPEFPMVSVR